MAIGSISQDAGVGRAGAVVRQFGDDDAYAVRTAVESEGRGRFETHLSKGISKRFRDPDASRPSAHSASNMPVAAMSFVAVSVSLLTAACGEKRGEDAEATSDRGSTRPTIPAPHMERVTAGPQYCGNCLSVPDPSATSSSADSRVSRELVRTEAMSDAAVGARSSTPWGGVGVEVGRPHSATVARVPGHHDAREPDVADAGRDGSRGAMDAGDVLGDFSGAERPGLLGRVAPDARRALVVQTRCAHRSDGQASRDDGVETRLTTQLPGSAADAREAIDHMETAARETSGAMLYPTVDPLCALDKVSKQRFSGQINLLLRSETSQEVAVELRLEGDKAHIGILASADDAWIIKRNQPELEGALLSSAGLSAEVTVSAREDCVDAAPATWSNGNVGNDPHASGRNEGEGRARTFSGRDDEKGEGKRRLGREDARHAWRSDRRLVL